MTAIYTTPDTAVITDQPRDIHWHHTIPVPVTYFGLRDKTVPLPAPVSEIVARAATRACLHYHNNVCKPCYVLFAVHAICYKLRNRILMILLSVVLSYLAVTARDSPPDTSFFLYGTGVATAIVYAVLLLGTIAAAIHRRRMPLEMSIRVARAQIALNHSLALGGPPELPASRTVTPVWDPTHVQVNSPPKRRSIVIGP